MPLLPQRESPVGRIARTAELLLKQAEYQWTTATPSLQGIPVVVGVPIDEVPTVEWLLLAAERIVQLVINFVDSMLQEFSSTLATSLTPIRRRLTGIEKAVADARGRYQTLVKAQGSTSSVTPTTTATLAALRGSLVDSMSQLAQVRQELTLLVAADLRNGVGIGDLGSADGLRKYTAIWSKLPIPSVAQNLHDDHVFANLRVAGANPMSLTRVRGSLPATFPLGEAGYRQVMGESLATAIAQKRVYLVDYAELGGMAPTDATYKFLTGTGYNSAPIALFAVPAGGGPLQPVAIQCGQNPGESPLVLRPAPDDQEHYWAWQMAKTVVQTADFNYHEMFVHLARTHLVSEAFCVATHRRLAPSHPLNVLLMPHFEGDIFINTLAALIIMNPMTFGDFILSGPIEEAQSAARRARLDWDFYAHMPRAEFAARGVDDVTALPEYPYRDDALLVWDSIHTWVDDYVSAYYSSDGDVRADAELAAWAQELRTTGQVKGFVAITSRKQLIDVVTMIIFTASAQHAAVNYPQADLMTYAPFSAGSLSTPPPTSTTGHTEADWIKQLPSVFGALAQMYFLNLLGGVFYRPLGQYRLPRFPYGPALTDPRVSAPLTRFHQSLQRVEAVITSRNATRSTPYSYLLPSQIPMSTNI